MNPLRGGDGFGPFGAGYLTYRTGDDGQPAAVKLTPEIAFNLDIAIDHHDSFLLDP